MAPYCNNRKDNTAKYRTQLLRHNQKYFISLKLLNLPLDVNVIYLVFKQYTIDFTSFLSVKELFCLKNSKLYLKGGFFYNHWGLLHLSMSFLSACIMTSQFYYKHEKN